MMPPPIEYERLIYSVSSAFFFHGEEGKFWRKLSNEFNELHKICIMCNNKTKSVYFNQYNKKFPICNKCLKDLADENKRFELYNKRWIENYKLWAK